MECVCVCVCVRVCMCVCEANTFLHSLCVLPCGGGFTSIVLLTLSDSSYALPRKDGMTQHLVRMHKVVMISYILFLMGRNCPL
jgi:hypothetical protein